MVKRVASVMMPRPPTWISTAITTSPNTDQWVAVSTTTSPVTHTAEVAVNSAVTQSADSPEVVAIGSMSPPDPVATTAPNPITTARAGCRKSSATAALTPRRLMS